MAISTLKLMCFRFLYNGGNRRLFKPSVLLNKRYFSISSNLCDNMRFVQYKPPTGGMPHLGAQINQDDDIIDISAVDGTVPNTLVKFLNADKEVQDRAKRLIAAGRSIAKLSDVTILSPLTKPDKVVCVGLNYKGHCDECSIKYPTEPIFFSKFSSTIIGPYDEIKLPTISKTVDWEVELGVVIGKTCKSVRPDQAMDYVFGYTVAQDISARDWQFERNGKQYLLGKSMDTFCPLGPVIVSKSHIPDPHNLPIKTWVNGVIKQDSSTSDMIFKVDFLISYLSQVMTLFPGDVILTGTPAGVGNHKKPQEFLKKGDVLESEIEGIGRLRNHIV